MEKIEYFSGTLRITNPKTLQRWKDTGKFQELLNEGYLYAIGCGRFRKEVCSCIECRKQSQMEKITDNALTKRCLLACKKEFDFEDVNESFTPAEIEYITKFAEMYHSLKSKEEQADGWIELKDGCEMPDYDVYVLWLFEDGNMHVEALDKDGNPWLFGGEQEGFHLPKATHYRPLPSLPKP